MKELDRLRMIEEELTQLIIKVTVEDSTMLTQEEVVQLTRFLLALRLDIRAQNNGINTVDDNFGMPNSTQLADYLLDHGVLCPPCKVGDKIYFVHQNQSVQWFVVREIIFSQFINDEPVMCIQGIKFDGELIVNTESEVRKNGTENKS